MLIYFFLINIFSYEWIINDYSNIINIINNNEIVELKKESKILENSFLDIKEKANILLKVKDEDIYLSIKQASIIAFSAYNNYSAHIYLIKGELELKNNSKFKVFTVETSTIVFNIMPDSELFLTANKDSGAYKVIATLNKGQVSAYSITGQKLTDMIKGDSFLFWKGNFIETLKKGKPKFESKTTIKKNKTSNELTLKEVEKELFGKIQSTEEIKKELLKDYKEKAIEIKSCSFCSTFAKIVFRVPSSLNLVAKNVYTDINLPAVFYKSKNSNFINEVYSNYKIKKDDTSSFIYELEEGIYYVTVLAGMPFKLEIKNNYEYIYNLSAFINPNYDVEVLSPLSMQNLTSIKSRPNPFFLFPGVYEFIIKDNDENISKQIKIKPGSVAIIDK